MLDLCTIALQEKVARLESLLQILITFVKRVAEAKMAIKELLTRYQSPIRPSCSNVVRNCANNVSFLTKNLFSGRLRRKHRNTRRAKNP